MHREIAKLALWFLAGYGAASMFGLVIALMIGTALAVICNLDQKSSNAKSL